MACLRDLNLEATELRLGLPGTEELHQKETNLGIRKNKRALSETNSESRSEHVSSVSSVHDPEHHDSAPLAKAKIVGWPPVRSYRKNNMQLMKSEAENAGFYVKVSMDGAPYLRKIDLNLHKGYSDLIKALEDMFNKKIDGCNGSASFVPTYEDKDGDWMLVGDVPWNMFVTSCKRLRIMKSSEARGLGHMV